MARTTKKKEAVKETAAVVTRAEKKDATKNLIREILAIQPHKHNELIDEVSKLYVERFGEGTDNINDVKGRVGSVLDIMKKESDVMYDGGMYALKARAPMPAPVPVISVEAPVEMPVKSMDEEKPAPKKRGRKPKAKVEETKVAEITAPVEEVKTEEKAQPLPPAPIQPIAPVAPVTPEIAPEPIPEDKPAPKKRGRKPKAKMAEAEQVKIEEAAPMVEAKLEGSAKIEETKVEKDGYPSALVDLVQEILQTEYSEEKELIGEAISAPAVEEAGLKEETPAPAVTPVTPVTPVTAPVVEEVKAEEKKEAKELIVKEKAEIAKPVMDMSFLFGNIKTAKSQDKEERKEPVKAEKKFEAKTESKPQPKAVEKKEVAPVSAPAARSLPQKGKQEDVGKPVSKVNKPVTKVENKPVEKAVERTVQASPKAATNVRKLSAHGGKKTTEKPLTADEKLREAFLEKIRALGGDYFEYYSMYLIERYSMRNGRRLEGMKISGGDHDGGIDGEIELTDKLGFKETIYIQSKNWNPEKGNEKLWVVGETLLQQFIGACACRQAKDGKQNCRGIFITTSRFTPEAKRILDDMSDKIVGYDGNDLYEAAKECSFGIIQKNGEWTLDEHLLAGNKAFFNLY